MVQIPQAARSLVHKNHLITWCYLELENSLTSPPRNAVEERGRLVGLVEGCVRACVEGEKQKSSSAVARVNGDDNSKDDEMIIDIEEKKEGVYETLRELKGRDDWLVRTERFVILASETAGKSFMSYCLSTWIHILILHRS